MGRYILRVNPYYSVRVGDMLWDEYGNVIGVIESEVEGDK